MDFMAFCKSLICQITKSLIDLDDDAILHL